MAVSFDTSDWHNIRMDLTDFSQLWTLVTRCGVLQPKHLSSELGESPGLQSADKPDYLSQPSLSRSAVGSFSRFSTDD